MYLHNYVSNLSRLIVFQFFGIRNSVNKRIDFGGFAQSDPHIYFDVGGPNRNSRKACEFKVGGCDVSVWFDKNRGIGIWDYLTQKNYYCTFDVKET